MQLLFPTLKNGLLQEMACYQEILDLAEEKSQALVKNDVEAITDIIKKEEVAMKSAQEMSAQQTGLLRQIAEKLQLPPTSDLTAIIQKLPQGPDREGLLRIQKAFQSLARELRTKNQQNQMLLEAQMQYNNFMIGLLSAEDSVGDIYGHTGQVAESAGPRRIFINQEA